jgi:hypothetical protein
LEDLRMAMQGRFLVGDLSWDRKDWTEPLFLKIKKEIEQKDIIKTREDDRFNVIDLDKGKFFDPEKNKWVDFPADTIQELGKGV